MSVTLLRSAAKELLFYVLLSTAAFVANLLVYVVYFQLAQPKYTFLTGNWLVVVAFVIECAAVFYVTCVRRKGEPDLARFRYLTSCVATGLLALYGLHATVFTIVERSVSINVIRYLAPGGTQPYSKIEQNFIDTFVYRDKAVCKRLDEQIHLGNVAEQNGQYAITPKGLRMYDTL
jgi:hypothetical protein